MVRDVAVYPFQVCRAILKGCAKQLKKDCKTSEHLHGIQERWKPEFGDGVRGGIDHPADELAGGTPGDGFIGVVGPKVFRDAVTGQPLGEVLVRAARSLELEYFKNKEVWVKVFRSEAMAQTGKRPIFAK